MTSQAPSALLDPCPSTLASFSFTLLNQWVALRCRAMIAASGEPHPLCPAAVGTQGYKLPVSSFMPLTDALRCPETGCPGVSRSQGSPPAPDVSSCTHREQDPWDLKDLHQVGAGFVCALGKHLRIIHLCHLQHHPASSKGNSSSSNPQTSQLCTQAAGLTLRRMKGYEAIYKERPKGRN